MKKQRKSSEIPVLVTQEWVENYFARGKRTAALLDRGKTIPIRRVISFEDTNDLIRFLTQNKRKLVAIIRNKPLSVTGLAKVLRRSRASIDKDIHELESVGIIKSEYVANPGHGKRKILSVANDQPIRLCVETVI